MKIICFSSYSSVWFFTLAEASIAHALQKRGHDVLFITSGNLLSGRSNLLHEHILKKEFDLKGYGIDKVFIDINKKEVESIMNNTTKYNFKDLVIDEINIGKIAMYEFLIHNKKITIDFTDNEWAEYCVHLKNTLISFFSCRSILIKEKPDRILLYNALYSVNHVWQKYAKKKGISSYFLHHSANLADYNDTLIIAKNTTYCYVDELKKIWTKVKDIPVPQEMLSNVTDHFLELLKAKHHRVYSAPKSEKPIDIRNYFKIKYDQKILTATLSSYDELFAAEYVEALDVPEKLIFASQKDWGLALIEYVKNRQNLFLIIRIHPREFLNKNKSVRSEHIKMLEKVFNSLPHNVKINWPTDNISLYDLAQETDVFLNGWSSVGVEMSQLGIPVVIYLKDFVFYPTDLNYVGTDHKDYFDKIELALKDGWSYEKIKYTYRWQTLNYSRSTIRLHDKTTEKTKPPKQSKIKNLTPVKIIARQFYHLFPNKIQSFFNQIRQKYKLTKDCRKERGQHIDISNLEKMLCESTDTLVNMKEIFEKKIDIISEDNFVHNEIKRLYEGLYKNYPENSKINNLQKNLKKASVL